MKTIELNNFKIANNLPFVFIGGPCQIENETHSLMVAEFLANLCNKLNIPFVFKSSFDKANRSSIEGKRGIGLEKSIAIFQKIKQQIGCPIITDIHTEIQCEIIGSVVDILQVPSFLCRQTDLIQAAAKNGKIVNIKKGQFMAPWNMKGIVDKAIYFGNDNIILTERGTSFGYNRLIVDMCGLDAMAEEREIPIIFDATHSVQEPGGLGSSSGGKRKYATMLAKSAIATRPIAGIFCEVHDNPDIAPSDGPNTLNFKMITELLPILKEIDAITKRIN